MFRNHQSREMRAWRLPLFEFALMLVRLDHFASVIVGTSLDSGLRLNYPNDEASNDENKCAVRFSAIRAL